MESLTSSFDALKKQELSLNAFIHLWRTQATSLRDLPPRYLDVLENILCRLESGSLFSEESCSFSQAELLSQLKLWLDKVLVLQASTNPQQ